MKDLYTNLMTERFLRNEGNFKDRLELTSAANLLLRALSSYTGNKFYCFPSHRTLAKITNLSISTVQRALKVLTKLGLVAIRRLIGRVNRYYIHLPRRFIDYMKEKGYLHANQELNSIPRSPRPTNNTQKSKSFYLNDKSKSQSTNNRRSVDNSTYKYEDIPPRYSKKPPITSKFSTFILKPVAEYLGFGKSHYEEKNRQEKRNYPQPKTEIKSTVPFFTPDNSPIPVRSEQNSQQFYAVLNRLKGRRSNE